MSYLFTSIHIVNLYSILESKLNCDKKIVKCIRFDVNSKISQNNRHIPNTQ